MSAVDVEVLERSGAGQDPRKRQQILDGARKLFLAEGFDAASMGDIARAAGVSKGTLYVYFDSKEVLFAELVREEKIRQSNAIFALDPADRDVAAVLTRLGRAFVRFITAPKSVQAVRGVIAIAQRMPELGSDFYALAPPVHVTPGRISPRPGRRRPARDRRCRSRGRAVSAIFPRSTISRPLPCS